MSKAIPSCVFMVHNTSKIKFATNDKSHAEWMAKCVQVPKTIFPGHTAHAGIYEAEETMVVTDSIGMSVYRFNETSLLVLLASFTGEKPATKMAILSAIGPVIDDKLVKQIWTDPAYKSDLPSFLVSGQVLQGVSRFEQLMGGTEATFDIFPLWLGPGPEISVARCDFDVDNQSPVGFKSYATTPSVEWLGTCTAKPHDIEANATSSAGKYETAIYKAETIAMAVYHVGDDSGNDKFLLLLARFGGNEPGATKMTIQHNPYCVRLNPKYVMDVWNDPRVTATLGPVIVQGDPVGARIVGTSCFRQLMNGDSAADFVIRPSYLKADQYILPPICGFNVLNETTVSVGLNAVSNAEYLGKCIVKPNPIAPVGITRAGSYEGIPGIMGACIAAAIYNIPSSPHVLFLLASFPGDQPVAILKYGGLIISSETVHDLWEDPQWTSKSPPFEVNGTRVAISSSGEKLLGGAEANFVVEYSLLEKN